MPVLETVLRADTRLFTTSLDQLRTTARPVQWASMWKQLAVLRRLIASPVTLDGMELEAATAAHAPGTVLRADTLRQVQQRDPERKTALPVTLAGM